MADYKEWWENLSPKHKRYVAIGSGVALALTASYVLSEAGAPNEQKPRPRPEKVQETVLTADYKMKDDTLQALASEMKFLRTENEKLRKEITRNSSSGKEDLDKMREEFQNEIARIQRRNDELESRLAQVDDATVEINRNVESNRQYTDEEIAKLKEEGVKFARDANGQEVPVSDYVSESRDLAGEENALKAVSLLEAKTPEEFFERAPTPREANQESRPVIDSDTGKAKVDANGKPVMTERVITITSHSEPKEPEAPKEKPQDYIFIPAGSILSGVFISGLDAPTGSGAQKNPFPTLVRLQKDAILPNNFKADIRECFMLLSGYGDLSSERALLRGEKISCIRDDGGVIETELDSFAVGDDGKAGVRGTLVSKQGQIIARSLLAGFAGGFAGMFDVSSTPTLNTNSDGTIKYEDVYSSKALKGGVSKGISQSLNRIADFYMDLADQMYPVIEIDAGRGVDIIVSKGTKLMVKSVNELATHSSRNVTPLRNTQDK